MLLLLTHIFLSAFFIKILISLNYSDLRALNHNEVIGNFENQSILIIAIY
jgi:hypothetical protein